MNTEHEREKLLRIQRCADKFARTMDKLKSFAYAIAAVCEVAQSADDFELIEVAMVRYKEAQPLIARGDEAWLELREAIRRETGNEQIELGLQ